MRDPTKQANQDDWGDRAHSHRFAGWEAQERATLEASLAATPAQRLEWLEEAIEIAWASGALPRDDVGGR